MLRQVLLEILPYLVDIRECGYAFTVRKESFRQNSHCKVYVYGSGKMRTDKISRNGRIYKD